MPYTEEQRHRRMVTSKLRHLGRPVRIFPEEFALAEAKIIDYHSRGMGVDVIAQRSGIGRRSVGRIVHQPGLVKTLSRPGYDRLMAMSFEPPAQGLRGSRLSPKPLRRRVQALWLAGYSLQFQAQWLDSTTQVLSRVAREDTRCTYASWNQKVAEMYDKLIDADPREHGLSDVLVRRTQAMARGRGFAPATCWDDDTIDDPEAFPEWTGACGTRLGRTIHKRDSIPICKACQQAVDYAPDSESWELDSEYLIYLMERGGVVNSVLADALGVAHGTVGAWRWGTRRPSIDKLEQLAEHFGVHVSELKL